MNAGEAIAAGVFLFRPGRATGFGFAPAAVYGRFNFVAGPPHSLYMMDAISAVSTELNPSRP